MGKASLVIRREQLRVLQRAAEDRFVTAVCRHVRSTCPQQTQKLSENILRERVRWGLAKGRWYGLTWQSKLAGFVGLLFQIGPDLDEHPWIRRILRDTRKDPHIRFDELVRVTPLSIWFQARNESDPSAWSQGPNPPS